MADRPQRSSSRLDSFLHAFRGWAEFLRTTPNARIHAAAVLAVSVVGIWLGLDTTAWAVLWLTIGMVITAEFINSALESVVDLASPNIHPLARSAKDVSAGGVLFAACCSVVVGLLVLGPPLVTRLALILLRR